MRGVLIPVLVLAVAAVVLALIVPAAYADPIVITDGTFANSDWTTMVYVEVSQNGDSHSEGQTTGGNPGTCRQMHIVISGLGTVSAFHKYNGASYNPSVQGAISSIDYSEDQKA